MNVQNILTGLPARAHGLIFDRSKPAELSIGVARIGLAVSMLWTLWRYNIHFSTFGGIVPYAESYEKGAFYAFGLAQLWGGAPPPPEVLQAAMWTAIIASSLSLIGLFSRPSTIVAVLSLLLVTSWKEGSYPYWSHGFNVVSLAGLAFMLGQSGASLSVDRVLARRFARYPFRSQTSLGLWWPVAAGQAAIALFYFGAGMAKHINGGMWDWVFSDNLRFSLAVTWYGYDYYAVPWYIERLMNTEWLWITAAAGHLFTQFFPVLAILHKNNPWLRLAEGFVYAGGVFLLYIVMTVWNPVWVPLAVFFVDWDWFARKLRPSPDNLAEAAPVAALPSGAGRLTAGVNGAFIAAVYGFFAFYIATFMLQIGHRHLIYPFSDLDFYSTTRAKQPYNIHQSYDFYRGQVRVRLSSCDADNFEMPPGWSAPTQRKQIERRSLMLKSVKDHCEEGWFTYPNFRSTYPEFYRIENPDEMRGALMTVKEFIERSADYALPGIQEVVVEKAIWAYPAYPLPAKPVPVHHGPRAYLNVETGDFRYVNSKYYRDEATQELRLDLEIVGFDDPIVEVFYRHNVREQSEMPPLKVLDGAWAAPNRFLIDEKGGAWEKPAFALYHIRERRDPTGRVWEFWGQDNLS